MTDFLSIPFFELQPQHCRYPRGGDGGASILFCGQPKTDGSSYCAACRRRCYGAAPKARDVPSDEHDRRAAGGMSLTVINDDAKAHGEKPLDEVA